MRPRLFPAALLAVAVAATGCGPGADDAPAADTGAAADTNAAASTAAPEATSLLGQPLRPREFPPETRTRLQAQLDSARAAYDRAPADADSIIWLGRRLAYLERYRDAIAVFAEGIEKHPTDARMYRHRGHRLLTLRRFADAQADFEKAAELVRGKPDETEPDGAPNRRNIPTSTTQGNIYYHLALSHYLQG